MERHGKWNDISEQLYNEIPLLKQNQVVKFKFLNGAPNNHPESKEREKQPEIFPKESIVLKDKITDPYKGKHGESVDIGVWTNLNEKGIPEGFVSFMPWAGQYPYTGTFFLIGGRGNDNEIFEFLFLSNRRKDNPHRKTGEAPLFEMVDVTKDAKGTIKKANMSRMALNAAGDMTLSEKREYAAVVMWGSDLDEEILDGKLSDFAMKDPAGFMKIYGDPDKKAKIVIGQAAEMQIIKFDGRSGWLCYGKGDVKITKLEVEAGTTWIDAAAEFIKKHRDGSKVLTNIKAQLKDSVPVVEGEE